MQSYYQKLSQEFSKEQITTHFSAEMLNQKIHKLACALQQKLDDECFNREVIFVMIAKGGLRFGFDLIKHLTIPYYYDIAILESYGDSTRSTGKVNLKYFNPDPVFYKGKAVVLLDDICDTGNTLQAFRDHIKTCYPSVYKILTCTLIWRYSRKPLYKPDLHIIQANHNDFFVGYGLGYGESCRHLQGIVSITR